MAGLHVLTSGSISQAMGTREAGLQRGHMQGRACHMPTAGLLTGPAVISHQKGMSPMSRCVRCRSHLRSQGGTQGYSAFSVNDRRRCFLDCLMNTTEARGWGERPTWKKGWVLAWAAKTRDYGQGLNKGNILSCSLESEVRGQCASPAGLWQGPSSWLQMAPLAGSSHSRESQYQLSGVS